MTLLDAAEEARRGRQTPVKRGGNALAFEDEEA